MKINLDKKGKPFKVSTAGSRQPFEEELCELEISFWMIFTHLPV
jgi:hypothetical protein